jgi:O-antigen ligase
MYIFVFQIEYFFNNLDNLMQQIQKSFLQNNSFFKKASFYLSLGVAFTIAFPRPINLLVFYLWILIVFLEGNFVPKFRNNLHKYSKMYISLFIAFAVIHILSALLSNNTDEGLKSLTTLLSAFILPLLFLISSDLYKKKINILLFAFLIGNVLALLLCLTNSFINSFHVTDNGWFFQTSFNSEIGFLKSFVQGENRFSYTNLSFYKHPSYFAMYSVFSMGIVSYLRHVKFLKRWMAILLIAFLFICIYLLSSRAGILSAFIYFIVSAYVLLSKKRLFWFKYLATLVVLAALLMLVFSQSRLQKTTVVSKESEERSAPRIELWQSSWELAKNNFIFGLGLGDVDAPREEMYKKNNVVERMRDKNSHNQYLETLLYSGIFGLVSLILLFFVPFINSLRQKNYLLFLFLLIVGFNLLFESMLNRFQGVFFVFFFLSLFLILNPEKLHNTLDSKKKELDS